MGYWVVFLEFDVCLTSKCSLFVPPACVRLVHHEKGFSLILEHALFLIVRPRLPSKSHIHAYPFVPIVHKPVYTSSINHLTNQLSYPPMPITTQTLISPPSHPPNPSLPISHLPYIPLSAHHCLSFIPTKTIFFHYHTSISHLLRS